MKPILADLGLVTKGDERAWAVTSPDDKYRYVLGRMWDGYFSDDWMETYRELWCFCMLNPSKARHDKDDPTIRKCRGFAKKHGAGGFIVVNLFAYSATDPKDLVRAYRNGVNIRGEHNEAVIRWAASRPALMGTNIGAWGVVPPRLRNVAGYGRICFQYYGSNVKRIGPTTKSGAPRHPLMLGYDNTIEFL